VVCTCRAFKRKAAGDDLRGWDCGIVPYIPRAGRIGVDQLAASERLPYVDTGLQKPRRLYRRTQIEVIAAARSFAVSARGR
jgi:hypothetical protein